MCTIKTFVIEHPITGGTLEIAERNFPNKMTWNEAKIACKELGEGWRLPQKALNQEYSLDLCEMEEISQQLFQKGIGNLPEGEYWSETRFDSKLAWCFNMKNESNWTKKSKDKLMLVRAVRCVAKN
jgi:hypothetical protein